MSRKIPEMVRIQLGGGVEMGARQLVEKGMAEEMGRGRKRLDLGKGYEGPEGHRGEENAVIEAIDDKAMLTEMMKEHLPIYRRVRGKLSADEILSAYQGVAATALVRAMMFGTHKESQKAAKEVLDRVLGRPIERQMSLVGKVDGMNLTEVDNELDRLLGKFGIGEKKDVVEAVVGEGAGMGGDEDRPICGESGTGAVSGVGGKD